MCKGCTFGTNTSPPFVLFELIRALHFSVHRLFRALFAQICKVFSVRESMILKIQDMLIRLINQLQKMSWFFCSGLVSSTLHSKERAGENTQLVLATNLIHLFPIFLQGSKLKRDIKVAQIDYVSRNQLHCTANLNFGLMCKKDKTLLGFFNKLFSSVQLIFFLDHVLLLAELVQKFQFLQNSCMLK